MTDIATCSQCKKNLPPMSARVYRGGQWICPDCLYLEENPGADLREERPIRRRRQLQEETLFIPPPPMKKTRR